MKHFRIACDCGRGAVFFCVARGYLTFIKHLKEKWQKELILKVIMAAAS